MKMMKIEYAAIGFNLYPATDERLVVKTGLFGEHRVIYDGILQSVISGPHKPFPDYTLADIDKLCQEAIAIATRRKVTA